jgi:hypothetical protein
MRPSSADVAEASTDELVEVAYRVLGELACRPVPDLVVLGSGLAVMDQVEGLQAALDLGNTAVACLVRAVEKSKVVRIRKFASVKSWLKTACGMRTGRVEEIVVTGRQLERLPLTGELLRAGKLSFPMGATIAEAVQRLSEEDCGKAEEIMLGWMQEGHTATQIANAGMRIREFIAERDGADKPPEDSRHPEEQSWWRLSKSPDGSSFVKGRFTPELTALVWEKLTRLAAPAGPDDTRDHHERLADALGMYLANGGSGWNATLIIRLDPDTGRPATTRKTPKGEEPAPGIVFDAAHPRIRYKNTSEPAPRPPSTSTPHPEPAPDAEPDVQPARDGGGVVERARSAGLVPNWPLEDARISARLADGTPISAWQARVIALNAGVSLLLLDSEGIPIYLGHKSRLFTAAQRRVIEALYQTCAFTECDVPARDCQLDHVTNWSDGGLTDIDLAAPACSYHNRLKYRHPEDLEITRDAQGRWQYRILRPGWRHWRTRHGRSP